MDWLAFFCLGAFIGGVLAIAWKRNPLDVQRRPTIGSLAIFTLVACSAVITASRIPGALIYPLGLLLALAWLNANDAMKTVVEGDKMPYRLVSGAYLLALSALTAGTLYVILPPAIAQVVPRGTVGEGATVAGPATTVKPAAPAASTAK